MDDVAVELTVEGDGLFSRLPTGMRDLGRALGKRPEVPVHIFLTHLHLDHLQGLAFFDPFWTEGFTDTEDAGAVSTYGRRVQLLALGGVGQQSTAEAQADSVIADLGADLIEG